MPRLTLQRYRDVAGHGLASEVRDELLRRSLDLYLRLRRSLGAEMRDPEATLRRFVTFAEGEGASVITNRSGVALAHSRGEHLPGDAARGS